MRRGWIVALWTVLLTVTGVSAQKTENSWKTYRNEKFGYEISYPDNFEYQAYLDGSSGELRDARSGQRLVDFELWPPDECPRQAGGTTAKEIGIERSKTITQADGPDGSSYCSDPLTMRDYAGANGARIYEIRLTCVRESYPESHDDTDDTQKEIAGIDAQLVISAEGKKGPTYFVDVSRPWRKRILLVDPVGFDPRMPETKGKIDLGVLRKILGTLKTFPIQQPPGVCIEDLQNRGNR